MSGERGFTLVEVLTAAAVMIVVISATLMGLQAFEGTTNAVNGQNDAQEQVRVAMDQLVRELRNDAQPTPEQPLGIQKATPFDLVFDEVDATKPSGSQNVRNVRLVRYCLDTSTSSSETLYRQLSAVWTTAVPPSWSSGATLLSTASCPDAAWPTTQRMAGGIVNAPSQPAWCPTPGNPCPGSSTPAPPALPEVTKLAIALHVAFRRSTKQTTLQTGVTFRSQDQPPAATIQPPSFGSNQIYLNATGSYDPEGDPLTYQWTDNGQAIGTGVALSYQVSSGDEQDIGLTVTDGAGLQASASWQGFAP
jgi:type II secretory pathway pseudopilin PulG